MEASATEGNKQATPAPPAAHADPSATARPVGRSLGVGGRATADNTKPQIITDEKTNTVRVLIGGKEILTIDARGLHVNGDIEYSGQSTLAGSRIALKPIRSLPPPIYETPESLPRENTPQGTPNGAHRP